MEGKIVLAPPVLSVIVRQKRHDRWHRPMPMYGIERLRKWLLNRI